MVGGTAPLPLPRGSRAPWRAGGAAVLGWLGGGVVGSRRGLGRRGRWRRGWSRGRRRGGTCLERRVRVFAAQQRLAGWLTYGRLVEAARWLRDWQARPPIGSGLPDEPDEPDGPGDPGDRRPRPTGRRASPGMWMAARPSDPVARAAMVERLEGVAAGYERRGFRVFGFQGTARQWAEEHGRAAGGQ